MSEDQDTETSSKQMYSKSTDNLPLRVLDWFRGQTSETTPATIAVATGMAFVIAFMTGGLFLNLILLSPIAFLVALVLGWWYLLQESNGYLAAGKSLYILGAEAYILPVMINLPVLLRDSPGPDFQALGAVIGGFIGILIWCYLAVGLIGAGFLLRRKGGKRLRYIPNDSSSSSE